MATFPTPNARPRPLNPFDKLSLFDAAKILDLKIDEVRTAIFKGKLRAVKIGGNRKVRRSDVMAFKAKREAEVAAESAE